MSSAAPRTRRRRPLLLVTLALAVLTASAPAARAGAPSAFPSRPYSALFDPPAVMDDPALTLRQQADDDATASAQNEQHPKPQHTGIHALIRTTASDFKAFPMRRSTYVILAIGGAAAALSHPLDDSLNAHLAGDGAGKFFALGKYLGYSWVQAGTAVGIYAIGRMKKTPEGRTNKVSHLGFDLLRANILTQALTYGVKGIARRDRPTGECCSFPSGHASVSFATASVLERHFGYRAAWPTFVVASYVAASRLHDNRHFLSDVVFGSALGIASGWTVVERHGRDNYTWIVAPTAGGVAATLTWAPGMPADRHGP
jgi:membrane-associated phospholipid phosphatase